MIKSLCDRDNSLFLHEALKGDTLYKGRHCHIIWDSTNASEDALGSVTEITGKEGNVLRSYRYDAWGEMTRGDESGDANPFRYVGSHGVRWKDNALGMYHMGARWMNPQTGRFTQRDKIINLNRYSYAKNNPIVFIDPGGLEYEIFDRVPRPLAENQSINLERYRVAFDSFKNPTEECNKEYCKFIKAATGHQHAFDLKLKAMFVTVHYTVGHAHGGIPGIMQIDLDQGFPPYSSQWPLAAKSVVMEEMLHFEGVSEEYLSAKGKCVWDACGMDWSLRSPTYQYVFPKK